MCPPGQFPQRREASSHENAMECPLCQFPRPRVCAGRRPHPHPPHPGPRSGPAPAHHLKDGEVLQDAIHHIALGQLPQLVQEIHQVLAHGRAQQAVHEPAILELGTLRLNQGTGSGEDGD